MAGSEHEKTKDPLPPRPRGPHPYPAGHTAVGGAFEGVC